MLWPKKADRAGLHAGRTAWGLGLVRGRGRPLSSRAASRGVVAATRATDPPAARIHPGRHNQGPDPVSSRHRPGAAPTSGPRHQCGPASLATRASERDPGRTAPSCGFIAGCGRHASGVGGVAGGPEAALHLAARPTAAAAVAGVGQSRWPQDARVGAVAVRAWGHAALHARGRQLAQHGRVDRARAQAAGARWTASA